MDPTHLRIFIPFTIALSLAAVGAEIYLVKHHQRQHAHPPHVEHGRHTQLASPLQQTVKGREARRTVRKVEKYVSQHIPADDFDLLEEAVNDGFELTYKLSLLIDSGAAQLTPLDKKLGDKLNELAEMEQRAYLGRVHAFLDSLSLTTEHGLSRDSRRQLPAGVQKTLGEHRDKLSELLSLGGWGQTQKELLHTKETVEEMLANTTVGSNAVQGAVESDA